MVGTILPLIPEHQTYTESFCGGAAVFWAKPPSGVEVINDTNREIVNFYRVLQTDFDSLWELIDNTLHSRAQHDDAGIIYRYPHLFTPVQRAWALWVQTNQSFTSKILGGWAYGKLLSSCEKKTANAKERFKAVYSERLASVQVECNDAVRIIQSRDNPQAFHYADPPYLNSEQGHYGGYTEDHFRELLQTLATVEGKFLLSSYPHEILEEFRIAHGWYQRTIEQTISAGKDRTGKKKIEVLTANYPI